MLDATFRQLQFVEDIEKNIRKWIKEHYDTIPPLEDAAVDLSPVGDPQDPFGSLRSVNRLHAGTAGRGGGGSRVLRGGAGRNPQKLVSDNTAMRSQQNALMTTGTINILCSVLRPLVILHIQRDYKEIIYNTRF